MSVTNLLQHIELFAGLTPEQVEQISALGREERYNAGDTIISEGAPSHEMYIICEGAVEVEVGRSPAAGGDASSIVRLGQGQVFGEMSLLDSGARSATVRCATDGTILFVIPHGDFWNLCNNDHHIGFVVMRNLATDLSFKLRHRNLQERLAGGAL